MFVIGPEELTPEIRELRIAVAQDAINQARLGKTRLSRSMYLMLTIPEDSLDASVQDLRDLLPKVTNCRVCALGACLVSLARVADAVPMSSFRTQGCDGESQVVPRDDRNTITAQLDRVFDRDTQDLLEYLFEGWHLDGLVPKRAVGVRAHPRWASARALLDEFQACYADRGGYPHPAKQQDRFFALMQNIVDNNGQLELESLVKAAKAVTNA